MAKKKNRRNKYRHRNKPKNRCKCPVEPRTITRHHILPKCRNGNGKPHNIAHLKWEKHKAWHSLFGNRTLTEAIQLLERWKAIRTLIKGKN